MDRGLVHLYTGDGKGKTTASVGLAVRAVGTGCPVVFAQFLKSTATGELASLAALGIKVIRSGERLGFTFGMDDATKARCKAEQQRVLAAVQGSSNHAEGVRSGSGDGAATGAGDGDGAATAAGTQDAGSNEVALAKKGSVSDDPLSGAEGDTPTGAQGDPQMLVVLDEVLDAVALGFLTEDELRRFIDEAPEGAELVMTGREAPAWLSERAAYHSEVTKRRHPFDQGIPARRSIEF